MTKKPAPKKQPANDAASADQLGQLKTEIAELKTGWQRTQADFENYKKRAERETSSLINFANEELIKGLLQVIDNLEIIKIIYRGDTVKEIKLKRGGTLEKGHYLKQGLTFN